MQKSIRVTGFDASPNAIQSVIDGDLFATFDFNPWYQFGMGARYLYAVWSGEVNLDDVSSEDRAYYTPVTIITAENAQEFYDDHVTNLPKLDFENWKTELLGNPIEQTW